MPFLTIRHTTRYCYNRPVGLGEHRMMFRPRESYDQRVLDARLTITPRRPRPRAYRTRRMS